MTLRSKLIGVSISVITCFALIIWLYFIPMYRETLITKKEEQLKSTTNQLITTIDHMLKEGKKLEDVIDLTQDLRYGENNSEYFLLLKPNGILLKHPTTPSLDNTDVTNVKDPNNFPLVKHYLDIGNNKKAGYLSYHWTWFNNKDRVEPKLAYIYKYDKLNLIIISTIYTNDINNYIHKIKKNALLVMSIGVLWSCLASFLLIRNFVNALKVMKNKLQDLNNDDNGNLKDLVISTNDELGELGLVFNIFLDKIRNIIMTTFNVNKELTNQCKQLSEYIAQFHEITNNGNQLSHLMNDKFQSLYGALGNINKGIRLGVEDTSEVSDTTQGLAEIITEISKQTTTTKSLADDVQDSTKSIEKALIELIYNHDTIDQVVTTISSITEQTALLAFNARIEAARALEAGKSFAVVADEINLLAKESANATIKITDIIQKTKQETVTAGKAINSIFIKTIDIVNNIATIASAIEEQSITAVEIAKVINRIDDNMMGVRAESDNASSDAEEIKRSFIQVMGYFKEIETLKEALMNNVSDLNLVKDNLQITLNKFKV